MAKDNCIVCESKVFEAIYNAYAKDIRRFLFYKTQDVDKAEDILQEEPNGYFRIYQDNGQLKAETTFTNGVQENGDVISYHDNGTKARKVTLENHLINGPYYEWYRNGQLKTEGIYNDKVPTVFKEWDENGNCL